MKPIYHSDRVKAIANLIHLCYLIADPASYWENTYVWTDSHLRKALTYVPQRFKYRKDGLEAWSPELDKFIEIYQKDFIKYEITFTKSGYLLYKGKEVRNISNAEKWIDPI
jgi:hypothetical protein